MLGPFVHGNIVGSRGMAQIDEVDQELQFFSPGQIPLNKLAPFLTSRLGNLGVAVPGQIHKE
ncbi:hypothetical protein D3C75_1264670 [compost metagenome]